VSAPSPLSVLQPPGWPVPRGYVNGVAGTGRTVLVAGQVGWDAAGRFPPGFVAQAAQALRNVLAVVAEAGGGPEHVGRLTWYVLDIAEYRASLRDLGAAYRDAMGRHFPAMTLVQVSALAEPEARLEIEATAIVPD
jgi:enamine deaminase RidA (YjgF/YER057c/UK114 family)